MTQLDRIEEHAREAAQVVARVDVLEVRVDQIESWQTMRDGGTQCAGGMACSARSAREAGEASGWRAWAGWLIMLIGGGLIGIALSRLGVL